MSAIRKTKREISSAQPTPDVEELAKQARKEREQKCMNEVNALLAKYRCQIVIVGLVDQKQMPIEQILNLPVRAVVGSK